jgi:hypothetical protein
MTQDEYVPLEENDEIHGLTPLLRPPEAGLIQGATRIGFHGKFGD